MLSEENVLRVYENRVLRRIFGPERDEVTRGLGKLHNEELHNLYFSPNMIRNMKSRRISWTRHVARMVEMSTKFWVESLKGRDNSENPG
jgi:hypothetical protein